MKWSDLSEDAKSVLEWVEHVWTGKAQTLTIVRGQTWVQSLNYVGDVRVPITDQLFNEIKSWLPHSRETVHKVEGDTIIVTLKDGVKLH